MRITLLAFALVLLGTSVEVMAAPRAGRNASVASTTHVVRKGETASKIARQHGMSLARLKELNPSVRFERLTSGTVLKVGGRPAVAKAEAPAAVPGQRLYTNDQVIRTFTSMPSLPATPEIRPMRQVHLERMLPPTLPGEGGPAEGLAGIRPVIQEGPDAELYPPTTEEATGFQPADPEHLDLLWPVETRTISSAWGPRIRSRVVKVRTTKSRGSAKRRVRYRGSHKGLDLTAPQGTAVFSSMDGRVVAAGRHKDYGNFVTIDHGHGVVTLYGHHRVNYVHVGEVVHRGQKIAEVGRTGNATGPHLHFELRVEGAPRNPLPVLNDTEEIPADMVAFNEALVAPPVPPAPRRRR